MEVEKVTRIEAVIRGKNGQPDSRPMTFAIPEDIWDDFEGQVRIGDEISAEVDGETKKLIVVQLGSDYKGKVKEFIEITEHNKEWVMPELNLELAKKVLNVVDAGLVSGMGDPIPGKMCVEAAICYAIGLHHDDDPKCVESEVSNSKICINDLNWSSIAARTAGLRAAAICQLGSKGAVKAKDFRKALRLEIVKALVPIAIEYHLDSWDSLKSSKQSKLAVKCKGCTKLTPALKRQISVAFEYTSHSLFWQVDSECFLRRTLNKCPKEDRIYQIAADCVVNALRECKSPGVALWDQVLAEEAKNPKC